MAKQTNSKLQKSFKFKLYNSDKNQRIHKLINLSAGIYNHCIALHKRYYQFYKKHLNKYQLQKHLTKLKGRDKAYYSNLPSQSIQQITERIDNAYQRFYDHIKQRKAGLKPVTKVSPPNFKKRVKYKSFTLKQGACKLNNGCITINKHKYHYFNSRPIEGKISTITVKRDILGDIYISVTTELEIVINPKIPMTGKSAGFDFGLKQFLTSSDKLLNVVDLTMVRAFVANSDKLRKLQQQLSSKQKVSNQRKKAKINVARLHKKIANQREFYHHKMANLLLNTYDVVYFETLNIKAMQKLWGKKISDYGFSEFVKIIQYKAAANDKHVGFIDKWYPSSKTCSDCGYIHQELKLSDRKWDCLQCHSHHDRDKNAAINIHRVGVSTLILGNVSLQSNEAISA
jgi:putative transposase